MSCPICRNLLSGAIADDGGSLICMTCGLVHVCANGQAVRSNLGPKSCPQCQASRAAARPLTLGSTTGNIPTYCPFCQGPIESDPSGNGYRCFKCGPWHMCHAGPMRSPAAMCNYCSARSTRSSRHALPHPNPVFAVPLDKTPRQAPPTSAFHACPTCHRPY